jgi:hypothetical protein
MLYARRHRGMCSAMQMLELGSHTLITHTDMNAMSLRSWQAKIVVRPASRLHCATKAALRMSSRIPFVFLDQRYFASYYHSLRFSCGLSNDAWVAVDERRCAKLRACPQGSVRCKDRSPQEPCRRADGVHPWATAMAPRASTLSTRTIVRPYHVSVTCGAGARLINASPAGRGPEPRWGTRVDQGEAAWGGEGHGL